MTDENPKRIYMRTTTEIENPCGDARSNRSAWRSPLTKTTIPADFVWYVVPDSLVIADATMTGSVGRWAEGYPQLLLALTKASVPAEETFATVLRDFDWRTETVVNAICKAKGISPAELRTILEKDP